MPQGTGPHPRGLLRASRPGDPHRGGGDSSVGEQKWFGCEGFVLQGTPDSHCWLLPPPGSPVTCFSLRAEAPQTPRARPPSMPLPCGGTPRRQQRPRPFGGHLSCKGGSPDSRRHPHTQRRGSPSWGQPEASEEVAPELIEGGDVAHLGTVEWPEEGPVRGWLPPPLARSPAR